MMSDINPAEVLQQLLGSLHRPADREVLGGHVIGRSIVIVYRYTESEQLWGLFLDLDELARANQVTGSSDALVDLAYVELFDPSPGFRIAGATWARDTTDSSDIVWRGVDITAPALRGRVSEWHRDESAGGSGRFTASHVPLE